MKRFPIIRKKIFTSLLALTLILSAIGTIAPRAAHAQYVDPITSIQTFFKNIFDGLVKAYNFAEKHIGDAAAVAYKQALRGVLNTIAVETAKAIATGDWDAPVFNYKKGFYSALADAAVGDLLSTFVSTGLGIDLCSYQPDLTLPLIIPLLRLHDTDYKYAPKCTLSGIAANAAKFDAKKSFKVSVSVTTFTFDDLSAAVTRLSGKVFMGTMIKASLVELINRYRPPVSEGAAVSSGGENLEAPARNTSTLVKDYTEMTKKIADLKQKIAEKTELTEAEKLFLKDLQNAEFLNEKRLNYVCGIAADLQETNFAFYGQNIYDEDDCDAYDEYGLGGPDPMFTWDKMKSGLGDMAGAQSVKVYDQMQAIGNSAKDEYSAGMKRMATPFNLCYAALNRVMKVSIVNVQPVTPDKPDEINTELDPKTYQKTFFISAPNINGTGANLANVTYQQGGRLTDEEYADCQFAFNFGQLLVFPENSRYEYQRTFFKGQFPIESKATSDYLQLGDYAYMFHPKYVEEQGNSGPNLLDKFIENSVYLQASNEPDGEANRKYLLEKINRATAEILGTHEVFLQLYNNLNTIFKPIGALPEEMTQDEKNQDQQKNLKCEADPLCAQTKLAEAAAKASEDKYKKENDFAQEKGSLLNPETTPVSEQAKNVPEVKKNELGKAQSGQGSQFTQYTGKIFADSAGLFFEVLFNTAMSQGYKSLNNKFFKKKGIELPAGLMLADKDESALTGYEEPGKASDCTDKELDIMQAMTNLGKSLTNIGKTGCGAIKGITAKCAAEVRTNAKEAGVAEDSAEACVTTISKARGQDAYTSGLNENIGGAFESFGGIQGVLDTVAGRSRDTADSSIPKGQFISSLEGGQDNINFNNKSDYDLLTEMSICPQGQANPSLYHCTINPSIKDAIVQKMTIAQAISPAKNLLAAGAIVGIGSSGEIPTPSTGFTLSAAQKLRKARIMPLGFEFAARLKIACYQRSRYENAGEFETAEPHSIYPWMGDECSFGLDDDGEIAYRNEVVAATFQDIIDGYSRTGTLTDVCGNFGIITTPGAPPTINTKMSPFCGLVNPDWVLSMPTPQCDVLEYSDVLESQKGNTRLQVCTELKSEITPNTFGYCTKERNIWNISGKSCPAEYATCSTYLFPNGSLASFNKDSLVGEGICSEKNAGCSWVSTVKSAGAWQDTIANTTESACLAARGTWDNIRLKCSNSRLYLTGNVSACSPQDNGCSKVFGLKEERNNLALNGSFENSAIVEPPLPPTFWNAYEQANIPSTAYADVNSCITANNSVVASCTIHYPSNKTNLCLSQGGSTTPTGCDLVIANAQPTQCGYCSLGLDQVAVNSNDRSGQVFNPADCLRLNTNGEQNYKWYYQGQVAAYPYTTADADGEVSPFRAADSSSGRTASVYSQVCNVPANLCGTAQTCPIAVVGSPTAGVTAGGVASNGNNAMKIDLNKIATVGSQILVEYPLQTVEAGSTMVLAGDAYSVGFDIKASKSCSADGQACVLAADCPAPKVGNVPQTCLDITVNTSIQATLVKSFRGGRTDSRTVTIPISDASGDLYTSGYQRINISLTAITDGTDLALRLSAPKTLGQVYIDAVKLEYNSPSQLIYNQGLSSSYTDYERNTPLAVKLAPDYLNCRGYAAGNPSSRIADTDVDLCSQRGFYWDGSGVYGATPACYSYAPDDIECADYAPACRPDEAGCQLYTPADGRPGIPGVIGQDNYCPNECVGYAAFKQQPSYFEPVGLDPINYFIPQTAKQCSVDQVGCDEFTNLALGASANPLEYYSYLKQCVIPATGKGEAGYFIWQGSADGPPQLKTFNLQAIGGACTQGTASGTTTPAPAQFANDPLGCKSKGYTYAYNGSGGPAVAISGRCSNTDYNGTPENCSIHSGTYTYANGFCQESDLGADLDCLRFFDKLGNPYYRRLSFTIEASDSCTVLRKTTSNQAACLQTNGRWENNTCFYDALPPQSFQCLAAVNGCREYLGTTGANSSNVIFDNFESTGDTFWRYNFGTGSTNPLHNKQPAMSSESITTLGHSMFVADTLDPTEPIIKPVVIYKNRTYNLSFWAKTSALQSKNLGVRFTTAPSQAKEFVTVASGRAKVDSSWRLFQYGPIIVDWDPATGAGTNLLIENAGDTFLDNITLTSLQDSTYVVKETWKTPSSCDMTNLGVSQPQAQLGCQAYTNTNNQTLNLKSFSKLCRNASIGCQLVFDTNNSSSAISSSYNLDNDSPLDDLTVPADKLKAVVVNVDSICQIQAAGCQAVGDLTSSALPDIYVINNPDLYTEAMTPKPILCNHEGLGCKQLKDTNGNTTYLKVELNNLCSFQEKVNVTRAELGGSRETVAINGWFKDRQPGVGCAATPDLGTACTGTNKVWNYEYNQCTTKLAQLTFNDCRGFTENYVTTMADSCRTTYKGSWFDRRTSDSDDATNGCGCAKYPFDYYKNWEYPDNPVAAASCLEVYNQCSEFVDFNPNYLANGDFDKINDLDGSPLSWDIENLVSGDYQTSEQGFSVRAVELFKRTERDAPRAGEPQTVLNTPPFIYQRLSRLEKGKTYELNFKFRSDSGRNGVVGPNDNQANQNCRMPEAAVEAVPYYSPTIVAATPFQQNLYINKNNVKVFSSTSEYKDGKLSFIVPTADVIAQDSNGQDMTVDSCGFVGAFWTPAVTETPTTPAANAYCSASNPKEPTLDYEVRIYGPLNGACVNATGEKRYFTDNGYPLDKYLCEGLAADNPDTIALDNFANPLVLTDSQRADYRKILGMPTASYIAPIFTPSAPAGTSGWQWQGNCLDSSYLMDNIQVALSQDHLYYYIDDASLNRGSCPAGSNWDQGCISFTNTIKNEDEIIQVKPDRQCSEWLFCANRDSASHRCLEWTTCQEQDGTACVRPGSQRDPLRYQFATNGDESVLKSIDITNYRKRLGISEEFRINRWRAGDYDGYTIPNLPPIEQMYDRVPGTSNPNLIDTVAAKVDTLPPATYTRRQTLLPLDQPEWLLSNLENTLKNICRNYPEQTSPYPQFLKDYVTNFEGVNSLVKYDAAGTAKITLDPLDRTTICDYTKLSFGGRDLYVVNQYDASNKAVFPAKICMNGPNFGTPCASNAACDQPTAIEGNTTPNYCVDTTTIALSRPQNLNRGICIEQDYNVKDGIPLKVHGGLKSGTTSATVLIPDDINNVTGPNACLTYYPL